MAERSAASQAVHDVLGRLADGEFSSRVVVSDSMEEFASIGVSINELARSLEAERDKFEQRVLARTAELEQLNDDVMRLSEFGNLLQACQTLEEAYDVIEHEVGLLFPGLAGALFLFDSTSNTMELRAEWGGLQIAHSFPRTHCWALRRGQRHFVLAESPRLSCRHTSERLGDSICFPMSAQGETLGMLHLMGRSLQRPGEKLLTPAKQRLGVTMAEQTALSLANLRMRDTLGEQALRDPLTGLYNRRIVDEWSGAQIVRADQNGTKIGVMLLDIDHFKRYNDTHGHDAGDAVLRSIAATSRALMRPDDIVCRYGGEEFLVLVSDVDETVLRDRADRLRLAIADASTRHGDTSLPPVTVSIGVGLYPDNGSDARRVLTRADVALYAAKRGGRNRVCFAEGDESSVVAQPPLAVVGQHY